MPLSQNNSKEIIKTRQCSRNAYYLNEVFLIFQLVQSPFEMMAGELVPHLQSGAGGGALWSHSEHTFENTSSGPSINSRPPTYNLKMNGQQFGS